MTSARSTRVLLVLLAVGLLGGVAAAERRERPERGGALRQQQQQVQRARMLTRRVLHDKRVSPEIQQQATQLDELLTTRQGLIEQLETRHQQFVKQHQTDIDELEALRRQALAIDERLRAAREALLQSSATEITQLQEGSTRTRELIDSLRTAYDQQRRDRRRQ
jgi:hypothetical protein